MKSEDGLRIIQEYRYGVKDIAGIDSQYSYKIPDALNECLSGGNGCPSFDDVRSAIEDAIGTQVIETWYFKHYCKLIIEYRFLMMLLNALLKEMDVPHWMMPGQCLRASWELRLISLEIVTFITHILLPDS